MPSTHRRQFLSAIGVASATGLAGCSALGDGRPEVNAGTGLNEDTSHALENEDVYRTGDDGDLPEPPSKVDNLDEADAVLATGDADRAPLVRALRDGKPVAVGAGDVQGGLRGLLESARQDYTFGVEAVRARPVPVAVAVPGDGTVDTYTFVDDGGWDDPVLDAFGWALVGRVPECDTFVPSSSMDDQYDYAGSAHIAGRLETGEAYVSRTTATVSRQDGGRFVRLRTRLHAEANDGYAIQEAVKASDFPDDQRLHRVWPNPHTENGVQVTNTSDTVQSDFSFEATPESSRAKSALTACGGLRTEGAVGYDHRVSVTWKRDELLGTDRHYASSTGRGEWHLDA